MSATADRNQRLIFLALPFFFVAVDLAVPGRPAHLLDHHEPVDDRAADDHQEAPRADCASKPWPLRRRPRRSRRRRRRRARGKSDSQGWRCAQGARPALGEAGGRGERGQRQVPLRPTARRRRRRGRRRSARGVAGEQRRPVRCRSRPRAPRARQRRARARRRRGDRAVRGGRDPRDARTATTSACSSAATARRSTPSSTSRTASPPRADDGPQRVIVDAAGYRERREQALAAPGRRGRRGRGPLRPSGRAGRDERDRAQGRPRAPQGPRGRGDLLRGHRARPPPRRGPARLSVSRGTVVVDRDTVKRLAPSLLEPRSPTRRRRRPSTTGARARTCTSRTRSSGWRCRAVREAGRIADLGSGAGLPGLVLAAARPEARGRARRERREASAAWLERTVEALRAGERARRCARVRRSWRRSPLRRGDRAGAGRAAGAVRVRRAAAARGRRAGGVEGRGRTRGRTADGLHAAAVLGLERGAKCGRSSRIRASRAPDVARLSQDRRPRRRAAFRADREWPQNAR